MRRLSLSVVAVVGAGLLVAGCGGGGSSKSASSAPATPAPSSGATGVSVIAKSSSLGTILTDGSGRTLYMFAKDTGPKSMCSGACATAWPPATTTGKPTGTGAVSSSKLGETKRSDGMTQITYRGHPLYYFSGDSSPGQTNGNGVTAFGAQWFALSPAGAKAHASASKPAGSSQSSTQSGGSQSSGGGGYSGSSGY
jgi:predicted lipoprotein with Yx(FWY)xxD motif